MSLLHPKIDPPARSPRLMRALLTATLAVAGTLPLAASAAEEIYRWVDAAGVVHYTQVAPQGVAYDRVTPGSRGRPSAQATLANPRTPPATPEAGSAAPQTQQTPVPDAATESSATLTETQRQLQQELEQEAQERLAQVRAERRDNCEKAREQFRQFTTYARIRVSDDSGGMRILGEEERQQRIAEAQEAIVLNCEGEAG